MVITRGSVFDANYPGKWVSFRCKSTAKGWEIVEVYSDKGISGAKGRDGRPGLDRALRGAVQARYDVLAAWSVDRLGRSLQDLLHTLTELQTVGCDLYLHRQAIDTRTPSGRAMFQMLGVFAEFERAMIQERVRAGLARAKEKGTKSGRPIGRPPVSPVVESRIRRERRKGHGVLKIAREVGVGVSVVQRVLASQSFQQRPSGGGRSKSLAPIAGIFRPRSILVWS
jgi:DNA invertase Pin-like site-specific DNA recombinase